MAALARTQSIFTTAQKRVLMAATGLALLIPVLDRVFSNQVTRRIDRYLTYEKTEGPFAARMVDGKCVVDANAPKGTFLPGETVGFINSIQTHGGPAIVSGMVARRTSDNLMGGFRASSLDVGEVRDGPKPGCLTLLPDAPPGHYELQRPIIVYPIDADRFQYELPPIPFDVGGSQE